MQHSSREQIPVVGGDVVEYNPDNDWNELTAGVAAKVVKELAATMYQSIDSHGDVAL